MSHRTLKAQVPLDGVPSEFRIFRFGINDSSQGEFVFDRRSAKLVMEAHKDQAIELSMDYEHAALADPPQPAPASGWFELEVRSDGLWATNVRWTDRAREYLAAKEYRFFSPAFEVEDGGGLERVTRLINVALTNLPALKGIKPLVAAKHKGATMALAAGTKVMIKPEALPEGSDMAEKVGTIADVTEGGFLVAFDGVEEPLLYSADQLIEVEAEPVAMGEDEEKEPEPEKMAEDTEEEEMQKALSAALGLGEGAKDSEALTEAVKLRDFRRTLVKLTGAKTGSDALSVVSSWRQSHGEVTALRAEIAGIREAQDKSERDGLIAKAVDEGKVAAKDEEFKGFLLSLPTDALRTFVAKAPVFAKAGDKIDQPKDETVMVRLSDKERNILKQLGVTEEKYNAIKAAR